MSEDDRIGFAVSEMAFFCDASRTNSGPFKKSLRRRADFWRDYLSEHADSRVDFVDIYNRACGLSQS